MFNLKNTKFQSKSFDKSEFHRYSSSGLATININNSNFEINIPREGSYFSLQNNYISLEFNETFNVAAN